MKRRSIESVSPSSGTVSHAGAEGRAALRERLARAEQALSDSEREVRRLEREIAELRVAVRHAVGVEVHDDLGQLLTGAAFLAQTLLNDAPGELSQVAARLLALVNECALRAHRIAEGLVPVPATSRSLPEHLRELARTTSQTFGVHCVCFVPEGFPDMDPETISHLHSIAREAVVNAVRHSSGRHISIELEETRGVRALTVRDDGAGIRVGPAAPGLGLRNMHRRAELLGGVLSIGPLSSGGSEVRCVW